MKTFNIANSDAKRLGEFRSGIMTLDFFGETFFDASKILESSLPEIAFFDILSISRTQDGFQKALASSLERDKICEAHLVTPERAQITPKLTELKIASLKEIYKNDVLLVKYLRPEERFKARARKEFYSGLLLDCNDDSFRLKTPLGIRRFNNSNVIAILALPSDDFCRFSISYEIKDREIAFELESIKQEPQKQIVTPASIKPSRTFDRLLAEGN